MSVRVGIIGTGLIARWAHIPGYKKAGAEIVAVCDIKLERAQEVADEHGIAKVYTDWREMLDTEQLDTVSVCLPNTLHAEPSIGALERGIHVLCEKPLAATVADAERMFAAAHKSGKHLMAAQQMRFKPESQTIKGVVERGDLGDVYYAEATWMRRLGIPGWGAFHIRELSAGGPLLDIGVHALDLAIYLMGNPLAVSVSATTSRQFGHKPELVRAAGYPYDPESFDVEDFAVAFIRLEGNRTLLLRASWAMHQKEAELGEIRLFGDEGGASTVPPAIYRLRGSQATEELYTNIPNRSGHEDELIHWVEVVKGNATPLVQEAETMNVQRILNAAYESAASGREVAITA